MKATNTCFLIVYSIRSLVRFSKPINIFLLAMDGKRTLLQCYIATLHHYATFSTLNNPFAMGNELPPKALHIAFILTKLFKTSPF